MRHHDPPHAPPTWHTLSKQQVLQQLTVDPRQGLTEAEAASRLHQQGANTLPRAKARPAWLRLLLHFHNPLIYVLLAAATLTLLLRDFVDAGVILAVILINALIGYTQEGKAEQALAAVSAMLASEATVLRQGCKRKIPASQLVPGDLVWLESGDKVPADLRLLRTHQLHISEAALTGESLPVSKQSDPLAAHLPLAERSNMAYSGTLVSRGQGMGVVVATASQTEIGRIGIMVGEVVALSTPLTRRLDHFARLITLVILLVGALVFVYGYWVRGMSVDILFQAVVGLAVAAIPEGLPAIVTIVLAIGTRIMAGKQAIVRRLPAVESLGSVTIICSDKTGTLTCNEMTVVRAMLWEETWRVAGVGYTPVGALSPLTREREVGEPLPAAITALAQCALLCNDAHLLAHEGEWQLAGDPTEGALLVFALKAGLTVEHDQQAHPRVDLIPFESEHQYMATLHQGGLLLLKGAPERVMALCQLSQQQHAQWQERIEQAASQGERVLALAAAQLDGASCQLTPDMLQGMTLLGMVGMVDPPREDAVHAIAECQRAGIRVKMITGDHGATAEAIGRQLGLLACTPTTGGEMDTLDPAALAERVRHCDVYARASPEHKLRLIMAMQANGELVAMTGDGVNDAPALKMADIGVAMGHKGTDAAREASDLVLTDDHFATIARAVREGRVVFDNIKKSLLFILPTNGGQAGVLLLAILAGVAMPITAAQILWINMVTAVTLALAFAFEPAEPGVMDHPPRPAGQSLITPILAARIAFVTLLMIAVTFAVFEWELARGSSLEQARTAAVNMLALGELAYLFNVRNFTAPAWGVGGRRGNPVAIWVCLILVMLQLLFTYLPLMQQVFHSEGLDVTSWGLILLFSVLIFLLVECEKACWRWRQVTRI